MEIRNMRFLLVIMSIVMLCGFGINRFNAHFDELGVQKRTKSYSYSAVQALALDAALSFPSRTSGSDDWEYWSIDGTPCIFTTNEAQISGNGSRVSWENWPSGDIPMCRDFYSSSVRPPENPDATLPKNCIPVLTMANSGGPKLSYVVLAANGADTTALRNGHLTHERIKEFKDGKHDYNNYYYLPKFIRGGGLDGVSIELIGVEQCEGFELFRYQTAVENPEGMRGRLEYEGYFVGMK